MIATRRETGVAVVFVILAAGIALVWLLMDAGSSAAPSAPRPDEAAAPRLGPTVVEPGPSPQARTELAPVGEGVPATAEYLVPTSDPAAELARAREELRSALEASLFGSLDPGAILDAALALGRLEVDSNAYSEPDPSGCTVYPLLGTPDGTRAELWIGRSSKPEVARVLSLRLELDAAAQPYLLDGCSRSMAVAQLQMQLDDEGRPLNLSILTDFPPSRRNRDLGVPLDGGEIAQGVLYCFDAEHPDQWRARKHGMDAGRPGSWEEPSLVVAGRWPCPEKLEAFTGLLQSQYETVRH